MNDDTLLGLGYKTEELPLIKLFLNFYTYDKTTDSWIRKEEQELKD